MQIDLSDAEYSALCRAAECLGMTPEQFADMAVSKAIAARYVLPKQAGVVTPFQAPKRDKA